MFSSIMYMLNYTIEFIGECQRKIESIKLMDAKSTFNARKSTDLVKGNR